MINTKLQYIDIQYKKILKAPLFTALLFTNLHKSDIILNILVIAQPSIENIRRGAIPP